jgi:hypothetical protein
MKSYVSILLIAIAIPVLFSGCRNCYPCLAGGENFDVPYYLNQAVNFKNDADTVLSLTCYIYQDLPPDKYCGRVGSGSYGSCGGERTAGLSDKQDSLFILLRCTTGHSDDVEQSVSRQLSVLDGKISINEGTVTTAVSNTTVNKIESISINGVQYSNVYEYKNNSAGLNQCSGFIFSMNYGVLKFSIRGAASDENWVLAN